MKAIREVVWPLVIGLPVLLSGCFYSLAGVDMSIEGRHKMWIEVHQACIGKSTSNCRYWYRVDDQRPYPYYYLRRVVLENGHLEIAFLDGKSCHYFYEYEKDSQLIVGFRFEELDRYACLFSGA